MTIICPKTNRVCENTGCSEWKSCLSYTPSVAIPLHKEETPAHQEDVKKGRYIVGLKGYGKSAKPIYSDTPLIPAHQTGAIVCPFCNEEGFDKIGLKHHLQYYCNEYATITNL